MTTLARRFAAAANLLAFAGLAVAHQGPDPVAHWVFNGRTVSGDRVEARLGPHLTLPHSARLVGDAAGQALDLTRSGEGIIHSARLEPTKLPQSALSVGVWALIDEAESRGGLVAVSGHEAEHEAWRLGYNDTHFTFTLRTRDGGRVSLASETPYDKGKWFHVAAVYDGERAELYINGELDAESEAPSGPIVYPAEPVYAVGSAGSAGASSLRGAVREASVYDLAAKPAWVRHAFESAQRVVSIDRNARGDALAFVVDPYLQNGATDGMTVMWQTTEPGSSIVLYGADESCPQQVEAEAAEIHEVRVDGLEPGTQYFYRVETHCEDGQSVRSGVSTFTTAVPTGTPFAFAVISDTQFNPVVSGKLSKLAWAQRPSFLLHPGDLVDTGVNDSHWTQHFFPGMRPLISRVPFYPVLGNHEQNASNYYEYVSLPSPEYYYDFRYGDAHFFMIDTNRNVGPESEQYEWLDRELGESTATWKFACHHHPPYSSDENDYGDLWRSSKSDRGDLRARQLSKLYDKHGVDIVWNGHIHSYERTWPIKDARPAPTGGGPVYMIVGGGGGSLETPGPYRPFFQNLVRRTHHYVMTHVSGDRVEVRSYDLDDRLFDTFVITK